MSRRQVLQAAKERKAARCTKGGQREESDGANGGTVGRLGRALSWRRLWGCGGAAAAQQALAGCGSLLQHAHWCVRACKCQGRLAVRLCAADRRCADLVDLGGTVFPLRNQDSKGRYQWKFRRMVAHLKSTVCSPPV